MAAEDDCKSIKGSFDDDYTEDSKSIEIKSVGEGSEEDETLLVICDEI